MIFGRVLQTFETHFVFYKYKSLKYSKYKNIFWEGLLKSGVRNGNKNISWTFLLEIICQEVQNYKNIKVGNCFDTQILEQESTRLGF